MTKDNMFTFYLGGDASWLGRLDLELMVSRRRLAKRKTLPRATKPWILDSGGFTELSLNGRYLISPKEYVREVRRYSDEVGELQYAVIQDYMCEPFMLKKTGLSVREHQIRTIESYTELRYIAPDITWMPVLQGYSQDDYLRCLDMYAERDDYLDQGQLVGLGSICKRQASQQIANIISDLAKLNLKLHGFGLKAQGLRKSWTNLASSDSMAWASAARLGKLRLPDCTHKSKYCTSCRDFALLWRQMVLDQLEPPGLIGRKPVKKLFSWNPGKVGKQFDMYSLFM